MANWNRLLVNAINLIGELLFISVINLLTPRHIHQPTSHTKCSPNQRSDTQIVDDAECLLAKQKLWHFDA